MHFHCPKFRNYSIWKSLMFLFQKFFENWNISITTMFHSVDSTVFFTCITHIEWEVDFSWKSVWKLRSGDTQTASYWIWTHIINSISYDDNQQAVGTSKTKLIINNCQKYSNMQILQTCKLRIYGCRGVKPPS